ncbi:MAG: universal stress protein [Solirubrobacteraceae bacterium]
MNHDKEPIDIFNSPIIVAYDGSPNADDAVVLGRLLADATHAPLALAHVYRAAGPDQHEGATTIHGREKFLRERAQALLAQGARLADRDVARLSVASTTTATGIRTITEHEHAALVIFGSADRTSPGHVHPGSASRRLMQGLPCALGFAPVGLHEHSPTGLGTIAVAHDDQTSAAQRSAQALARLTGAQVTEAQQEGSDLLLVGCAPNAERGHIMVNGTLDQLVQTAVVPIIVVPHGQALQLAPASASAAA